MQTEVAENPDQTAQQDKTAVAAVKGGDVERYRELVERHERRVYAIAWSRLGDAALAEDAAQEAFIRAYRRLWLLGDGTKFAAWVNAIARRAAINLGLRHRRELNKRERWTLEQTPARADHSSGGELDATCTPETLHRTLAELPEAHRECLVLFYLDGQSGAEAAAVLGISEAAFRVRLHRARLMLRERLEKQLADSLGQLKPDKPLAPAVMAGVLAAKAATSGLGATLLSALTKFAPFKWLFLFGATGIGVLPTMTMSALAARAEQRNFRDPAGFRAQASRAMHRTLLWAVPLAVIAGVIGIVALKSGLGPRRTDGVVALITVGAFVFLWTSFGNRFQVGILVPFAILTVGIVLTATGLVPRSALTVFFVLFVAWQLWVVRRPPRRMDNNLFLRADLGMLEVPSPDSVADIPAARLGKADLMRFARFLGDRWLVNDFRWRPEGLLLRQKLLYLESSNILLAWNGEVTARVRVKNNRLTPIVTYLVVKLSARFTGKNNRSPPPTAAAAWRAKLEPQVAAAVKFAWREFRNGNIPAAEKALGEKPDQEIFVVPPARSASTRWRQAGLALVVVLIAVMIVWGQLTKIVDALEFLFSH